MSAPGDDGRTRPARSPDTESAGAERSAPVGEAILYGPALAPFTEKVRRALLLKGVEHELREPSSPEDYRRWNPETGLLPVLEIAGERVPDSTTILLRLDQLVPEPPLLSSEPAVAARQKSLEEWADESFLFYFLKYRRMEEGTGPPTAGGPARANGSSGPGRSRTLVHVLAWLRAGGTWERPHTSLLRDLGLRLDDLVNFLGARRFFFSDAVSMADLAVYSMLFTMRNDSIPGSAALLAQREKLVEFAARVERETGG